MKAPKKGKNPFAGKESMKEERMEMRAMGKKGKKGGKKGGKGC